MARDIHRMDYISGHCCELHRPSPVAREKRAEETQILLGTGIGQIKYLNRALMRFDSKVLVLTP